MNKDVQKKVKTHFEENFSFLRIFWMNKKNLSLHMGFWYKDTKNLHEALMNENKAVAEVLDIKKGDIVLDAGCGVGGTAIWLAEKYGVKVTGIDITEKYIEIAKRNAKKRKVDHLVSFYSKDYCHTNYPEKKFTKILSIEGFCYTDEKSLFLDEMYRMLRARGRIVIVDYFRNNKLANKQQELLNQWCDEWVIQGLLSPEDLTRAVSDKGFQSSSFEDKTINILPSSQRIRKATLRLLPLLKGLHILRLASQIPQKDILIKEPLLFEKNILKYGLFLINK